MERTGELRGFRADSFDIFATDISRNALAIASAGRYDPISMRRGLPLRLREQYFERDGRISVLAEELRKLVRFKRMNLLDSFGNLGVFDIVLLRNVLIYFAATWKRNILAKAAKVMRSESTLAAGATETLELYSSEFNVVRHARSTYYRLKES
jgi:chemotaxis protein methyltransferase CheR